MLPDDADVPPPSMTSRFPRGWDDGGIFPRTRCRRPPRAPPGPRARPPADGRTPSPCTRRPTPPATGAGGSPPSPGGRPTSMGASETSSPCPVETDHAVKLRRVGEQVQVGDSNSAVIYLDPQALDTGTSPPASWGTGRGRLHTPGRPRRTRSPWAGRQSPRRRPERPGRTVPLGDGLVDVVPDEAPLVGGDLLRQVDVPLLAAEGVAHGVAVLAADGGPGAGPPPACPGSAQQGNTCC